MNDKDLKRLNEERAMTRNGHARCSAKSTPYQCSRVLGHVGCHFAYITLDGDMMCWSDKGKRLTRPYPKQRNERGGERAEAKKGGG